MNSNFRVRQAGERQAMNAGIQGLAADIFKVALVHIDEALVAGAYDSRVVLQVHDEVIVDGHAGELELAGTLANEPDLAGGSSAEGATPDMQGDMKEKLSYITLDNDAGGGVGVVSDTEMVAVTARLDNDAERVNVDEKLSNIALDVDAEMNTAKHQTCTVGCADDASAACPMTEAKVQRPRGSRGGRKKRR